MKRIGLALIALAGVVACVPTPKVTPVSQGDVATRSAGSLSLRKLGESRVDDAVTIVGKWGNFINGKSYQQDAVATFNGWQYTTYYDQGRRLSRLPPEEPLARPGADRAVHLGLRGELILTGSDGSAGGLPGSSAPMDEWWT